MTFTKNRERLQRCEVFKQVMTALLRYPKIESLLSNEHCSVDGTLIEACPFHSRDPTIGSSYREEVVELERRDGSSLQDPGIGTIVLSSGSHHQTLDPVPHELDRPDISRRRHCPVENSESPSSDQQGRVEPSRG